MYIQHTDLYRSPPTPLPPVTNFIHPLEPGQSERRGWLFTGRGPCDPCYVRIEAVIQKSQVVSELVFCRVYEVPASAAGRREPFPVALATGNIACDTPQPLPTVSATNTPRLQ